MLYMVECSFTDPAQVTKWNAWYNGPKIASLLALDHFNASQRFVALDDNPSRWLAIHCVDGPEFFESTAYSSAGGGTFGEWSESITDWHRNLFDGMHMLDEIRPNQMLAVADDKTAHAAINLAGDATVAGAGPHLRMLDCIGLDQSVQRRAVAIIPAGAARAPHAPWMPAGLRFYRPVSPRIT